MLQPKTTKYKKHYKPRKFSKVFSNLTTITSPFALELIALESTLLKSNQIESARQTIRRKLKRKGRLKYCVYPDIGISKKPTSSRMGKGKGKIQYWVCKTKPGKPIFHLTGISNKEGILALKAGINKLPLKAKVEKK